MLKRSSRQIGRGIRKLKKPDTPHCGAKGGTRKERLRRDKRKGEEKKQLKEDKKRRERLREGVIRIKSKKQEELEGLQNPGNQRENTDLRRASSLIAHKKRLAKERLR